MEIPLVISPVIPQPFSLPCGLSYRSLTVPSLEYTHMMSVFSVTAYILPGTPSQVTLMEGQSALVSCTAGGDPAPEITWQQPTVVLAAHTSHIRLLENGSMFWQHARSADTGMYTCTASNMAGQDSKVINITVVGKLVQYTTIFYTCSYT